MVLTMSTEDLSCSTKSIARYRSRFWFLVSGSGGGVALMLTQYRLLWCANENTRNEKRFLSFPNRRMHLRRQLRVFQIQIVAFHRNDYFYRFGRGWEVLRERYMDGRGG